VKAARAIDAPGGRRADTDRAWPDAFMAWVESWPLPGWLAYPLLIALAIAGTYLLTRAIGWGTRPAYIVLLGAQVVYPLALTHYANGVARDAFNRFRPLLPTDADSDAVLRELTTVPARGAWTAAAIGIAIGASAVVALSEPEYARFGGEAATAPYVAIVFALTGLAFGVTFYRIFRQVRAVVRLHQTARNVDPLRPYPAHAFARLTAVLGLGLVVVTFAWSAIDIEQQLANPSFLLASVSTIVLGAVLFVAPLWGMHQRLVAERFRMLDEISERLERVTREIHTRAAALDVRDADPLNKLAGSLMAERDLVHRTSTWPWERGTASTFATALAAPIVLFLMTRLLGRFV
jgi:hypothetical protein